MYLDCDTEPTLPGRLIRAKRLETAIARAARLLADRTGQIGIYATCRGDGFAGYVIRYPGEEAYFEPVGEDE
jgi:hypothetical protein